VSQPISGLKTAIMRTPLYPIAREAYRAAFKPEARAEAQAMRRFYSQFIPRGSTVFDVGGLYGEYAEIFASCGAGKVVTCEPNPAHRARLQALSKRNRRIVPVFAAVSDTCLGTATLNVCSTPGYSTLAPSDADWMDENPDYDGVAWTTAVEVPLVTLGRLQVDHGSAHFVKIDVEGFELQVIRGLGLPPYPEIISFEFGARRKDVPLDCIRWLAGHGYRQFRPMVGREYAWATGSMDADTALRWLEAYPASRGEYGDMFAWLG
jgi:FkbM family methyltransferase